MATTTNFGWETPDDTDLVKDGAAAIRTALGGVDTSFVDLKGGTTGQVLSKASNTDLDYTWVTTDDANAIQNAIVDAKGDLIAASAADTPARLAVGNNGETLVADSSTATGLRYTAGTVQSNPFLNSAMQVWQRGTSIAMTTSSYTADRWQGYRAVAGSTVSRQATGDTTNLPNIQYCARVQRDSGNTSTTTIYFGQSFESVNSIPFAGKTVTFSFYARAGANYSSTSSAVAFLLQGGALTDANVITAGGWSTIATLSATLTTTWQRFSITATVPTSYTQLGTYGVFNPTGTAGAADYFEITGFQLDIGSVALPFRTYAGTIQGELAACQRYYFRQEAGSNYSSLASMGAAGSTTAAYIPMKLPSTMRIKPTTLDYSAIAIDDLVSSYSTGTWALSANTTTNAAFVVYTHGSAALTQYRPYQISANNNSAAYIGVSAEL